MNCDSPKAKMTLSSHKKLLFLIQYVESIIEKSPLIYQCSEDEKFFPQYWLFLSIYLLGGFLFTYYQHFFYFYPALSRLFNNCIKLY